VVRHGLGLDVECACDLLVRFSRAGHGQDLPLAARESLLVALHQTLQTPARIRSRFRPANCLFGLLRVDIGRDIASKLLEVPLPAPFHPKDVQASVLQA
jgi:hypothetical protein